VSAPRVVFVTDAGGEAGLGHFKRCAALAQALGARGCIVDALVAGPRDVGLAAVAPGWAVTPLAWWGAADRVLQAVAGRTVDAFVVDSYHVDAALLATLRRAALVVAIDDLADRPLPVDAVVNGAWHAEAPGVSRGRRHAAPAGPALRAARSRLCRAAGARGRRARRARAGDAGRLHAGLRGSQRPSPPCAWRCPRRVWTCPAGSCPSMRWRRRA
jgi:hypothetical protein